MGRLWRGIRLERGRGGLRLRLLSEEGEGREVIGCGGVVRGGIGLGSAAYLEWGGRGGGGKSSITKGGGKNKRNWNV